MKDNKKILSEIRRIHEIMGISKPLLNESIWDDLFKAGLKNADEAIVIGGKAVPDELSVAIRKASKQVDDGVLSVKNSLDDVLKVARASAPELVDDLINRIVNHDSIVDTYMSMIVDVAESVKTLVDEGKSLSDALKQVEDIFGPEFRNNKILPNEVYNKFLNDVIDEVGDYKPKTKVDGGTPKPDETPKPSETSIPNIEKSLNDIVDTIDDSEIAVINQKYTAWWGKTLERLKAATLPIFKGAETLQDAILRDIAIWQKTSPNARPVIRKRIIANLQELEAKNAELYEATQNWIDVEIRPMASKSPEVRNFYNKLQAKDGWPKVMILQNVFQGAGIGLRDVITNNKLLRGAWVKAMLKPFTIPTNIMSQGVINKIFNTNLSKVGKMSPEQWTAFKNWFWTTNPAGWEAVQQVFKNQGFIGGASYVTAQLIYRYLLVSTMIGLGRTLGALSAEGIDLIMGAAFDVDTDIADAAITNYLFGTSNLSEITQSLKDNPESSDLAHVGAIMDMIGKQSEPFRKLVGMWPAGTVGKATWDLIKLIQNGKLSEEIENLEREGEDLQRQIESAAAESGHPLPPFLGGNEETTTGNNSTPESSGEPGSLSHAIEELGDGVTQQGEFFIYLGDKYKWNGTYYEWIPE